MSFAHKWLDELHRAYLLRFTDSIATATLVFAMPLMIYTATQSIAWSGLAFFIEWLPRLLSIPAAGPLVDRWNSRLVFIATNGLRFAMLGVVIVWTILYPHAWPWLLVAGVVNGILGQIAFVAAEHLGVTLPTKKAAHQVQSAQVNIDQSVMVLGPLFAGLLLLFGNTSLLVVIGGLSILSILLALTLSQQQKNTDSQLSINKGFQQGLRVIRSSKPLQYVVLGTVAFNLLLALITVITPAIVKGTYHGTDHTVSIVWAAGAVLSIIAIAITSKLLHKINIVFVGTVAGVMASIAIFVASFSSSLVMYAVCVVLFITMDGVYAVYIRTARAKIVPREHFGVTVGVIVLFSLLPFPAAGLLVALLPAAFLPIALIACTIVCLIVTAISHIKIDRSALATETVQPTLQ